MENLGQVTILLAATNYILDFITRDRFEKKKKKNIV